MSTTAEYPPPGSPHSRNNSFYRGVQAGYDPRLLKSGVEFEVPPEPRQEPQQPQPQLPPRTREQHRYNYKPTPLKWWFLTILIAFLLVLISLTEVSIRSVPVSGASDDLGSMAHSLFQTTTPSLFHRMANVTTKGAGEATATATGTQIVAKTSSKVEETATKTTEKAKESTKETTKETAKEITIQAATTKSDKPTAPATTEAHQDTTAPKPVATSGDDKDTTKEPSKAAADKPAATTDAPASLTAPPAAVVTSSGPAATSDTRKSQGEAQGASSSATEAQPTKDSGGKSPPSSDSPSQESGVTVPPVAGAGTVVGDKGGDAPGEGGKGAAAPGDGKGTPEDGGKAASPPTDGKPGAGAEVGAGAGAAEGAGGAAGGGNAASPGGTQPPAASEVVATTTKISLCLDCTAAPKPDAPAGSPAHPAPVPVTTTVGVATVDSNGAPTTVPKAATYLAPHDPAPTTSMVQQVAHAPASTVINELVTTDAAGREVTQAVTSAIPAHAVTTHSAVVLYPGQSYATTTGLVTSRLDGEVIATRTKIFTDSSGRRITSTYVVTVDPAGATVFSTAYGTVVGNRVPVPTDGVPSDDGDSGSDDSAVVVMGISHAQYLAGSVLPVLLAVLVLLPLRAVDVNTRLFQPFAALAGAGPDGVSADASIFLRFHGRAGWTAFPRAVRLRQYVVVTSQLLLVLASLLGPIAAEAVRIHVVDGCPPGSCYGSLGMGVAAGRALQVLMALMVAMLLGLMVLLIRFRTGLRNNPWSIAGMASLGLDPDVRALLRDIPPGLGRRIADWEVWDAVSRGRYILGTGGRDGRYGIKVLSSPVTRVETLLRPPPLDKGLNMVGTGAGTSEQGGLVGRKRLMPFTLLTWWGRALLLSFFGVMAIIIIANQGSSGDSGFRRFMDNQDFGVRFFFAGLGVALGFTMGSFFRCE